MEKKGEMNLFPLINKWGQEILTTSAIAATRKHFLDAYKADQKIIEQRQLTGGNETKELLGFVGQMFKTNNEGETK